MFRSSLCKAVLLIACLSLAGCDTAKERAEKHYKAGMTLLEAGDVDRALVEFRNVFKLDGEHEQARIAYARAERDRGHLREAFAQYLRLIEQHPTNLEGQRALAEIAAQSGDWEQTEKYAAAAIGIDPKDTSALAVKIAADYGHAKNLGNADGMKAAAATARTMLSTFPDNAFLLSVIIDDDLQHQEYDGALAAIDVALKGAPDDRGLLAARLSTLAAKGDNVGVESGLKAMVAQFPEDAGVSDTMVRWYMSRHETDKAETFLRAQVGPTNKDNWQTLVLVRFLAEQRGADAAVKELDSQIAAGRSNNVIRSTRAGLMFDLGQQDEAVTEMEAILKDAKPSDETQKIRVGLARMQIAAGNAVGARALVEDVLTEDPGDLEAMKLKANWLTLDDNVGDAISLLRTALDGNPRDASVMTLLAQAYERDGNRELLGDMLSQATEASGRAPDESLRYAQFLMADQKFLPAESVLINALRLAPGTPSLLTMLAQDYVAMKDWPRAELAVSELEGLGNPATTEAAANLRTAILSGQKKSADAIGYLQGLVDEGKGGLGAQIAIIRAHLDGGQIAEAKAYSAKLLAANPADPGLRFVNASVDSAAGNTAAAETAFRELLAEDKFREQVWLALYGLLSGDPLRQADAGTVVNDGTAALPESGALQWAKAGYLEKTGDIDGAIAIYQTLYTQDSANMVVANNLASMLSSYKSDDESLKRAELIARRLRGSQVPAYQDTFGWIAYRRGNFRDAVTELEQAAAALTKDRMVQYHLAMTYLALNRQPEALKRFNVVTDGLPADDARDFVKTSRDEAAKLTAIGIKAAD